MSDWLEWKPIVLANVRRFELEQDEPWHHEALLISADLLELYERPRALRRDLAPLLVRAGALPSREAGATSIRKALIRIFLSEAAAPFDAIAPRTLVIDPYGDLAIVMAAAACPSAQWLTEQEFPLVRTMSGARWWTAYAVSSAGVALLAEPTIFGIGKPDHDRLLELVAVASLDQVKTLIELFPETLK